jgi:hypothetical protein
MSLDFLHRYGGRRLRHYPPQPLLVTSDGDGEDEEGSPAVDLGVEIKDPDAWVPRDVDRGPLDPEVLPRRFVDGCHTGETIAWLQDGDGHPIPVRLAEIGGVCLRADGRSLRREFAVVQRVGSLIVDPFPWNEVEAFATALTNAEFRLLPALPPEDEHGGRQLSYDFERMREQSRARAQHEMGVLEELALCREPETPSLIDGRLGEKFPRDDPEDFSLVGVIKSHRENYLHPAGWQTFYRLRPGQRTPVFQGPSRHLRVATWYLKLDGARGDLPNWGVVRVEIPWRRFERQGRDFGYIDRLSQALVHLRCRQGAYARAPVSLDPIVRAEESLKALFSPTATLQHHFFRLTRL